MPSLASRESDAIKCILEAIDRETERVMPIKTVSKAGARPSAHQSVSRLYRATGQPHSLLSSDLDCDKKKKSI